MSTTNAPASSADATAGDKVGEEQGGDVGRSDDIGKLSQEDHRRLDGASERKLATKIATVSGDEC